jgi:hypothetical protein
MLSIDQLSQSTEPKVKLPESPPPPSGELAMSMSGGIPGTCKFTSSPGVALGQHVNTQREIGNMRYAGEIGPMSIPNMQLTCAALSRLGPTVCLEADNSGNSHGRGRYHVYQELNDRQMDQLQEAARKAGNNVVEFGRHLAKAGGEIATVVADLATKSVEAVIFLLSLLWTLSTGGGQMAAKPTISSDKA